MKKETKERVVSALKVFLGEFVTLQRQKTPTIQSQKDFAHDIGCIKHVIGLIERHEIKIVKLREIDDEKLDLDKYDRISGSEWNKTLEKKDGDK